ncbi:hypothetical protein D9M69_537210 [compost metagenome]
MTVFRMEIVVWAIEIGRHYTAVITAMLAIVAFAQLDPRDLGDRVRLVGRLQHTGEKRFFLHRLFGVLGVNTRRTEKQQPLYSTLMRGLDDIGLNHQILVDEVRRVGVVGKNPTYLGRSQIHLGNLVLLEEGPYRSLIQQVQLITTGGKDIPIAQRQKAANDSRTNHSAMPCDENSLIQISRHSQFSTATGISWPCSLSKAWR